MLRIGTWNILGRRSYQRDGMAENGAVAATVSAYELDVLCLQEVHFYGGAPERQTVDELRSAGLTNLASVALAPSHLDPRADLGLVIASRFPLSSRSQYLLRNPRIRAEVRGKKWVLHDKGLLDVKIHPDSDTSIRICTLHLFPFFEFGVPESHSYVRDMWNEFWKHVGSISSREPLVLAGDFNHQSRASSAHERGHREWRFHFANVATSRNGMPLDDIALNWPAQIADSFTSPTFSDHYLIGAEIDIVRRGNGRPVAPILAAGGSRAPSNWHGDR